MLWKRTSKDLMDSKTSCATCAFYYTLYPIHYPKKIKVIGKWVKVSLNVLIYSTIQLLNQQSNKRIYKRTNKNWFMRLNSHQNHHHNYLQAVVVEPLWNGCGRPMTCTHWIVPSRIIDCPDLFYLFHKQQINRLKNKSKNEPYIR